MAASSSSSGLELLKRIDLVYTTTSNDARRAVMGELQHFFTLTSSWQAAFELFHMALATTTTAGTPTKDALFKRRARVCFFAANALLSKIKRESASLENAHRRELAEAVHSVLFAHSPAAAAESAHHVVSLLPRDVDGKLLGRPCGKRLVLCLAYLTTNNKASDDDYSRVQAYVSHACFLVQQKHQSPATYKVGMEMLLALAGGGEDTNDDAISNSSSSSALKRTTTTSNNNGVAGVAALSLVAAGVLDVLQQQHRSSSSSSMATYTSLGLDVLHAWTGGGVLGDNTSLLLAEKWPALFHYAVDSIAVCAAAAVGQHDNASDDNDDAEDDAVDLVRTSSHLLQSLAENTSSSSYVRDALQSAILRAHPAFIQCNSGGRVSNAEDVQQAIASAFAQIAEHDTHRICRTPDSPMIPFALDILASPCTSSSSSSSTRRCAVCKNVIDFWLAVLDEPVREIANGAGGALCLQVLRTLLSTCQFASSSSSVNEDVTMFRLAGDGPGDLFAALYLTLQRDFLVEVAARVAGPQVLECEAAVFALRCAAREICNGDDDDDEEEEGAVVELVRQVLSPAVLQRVAADSSSSSPALLLREEMCRAVGDFAALLSPPALAFGAFEFVARYLGESKDACASLHSLGARHAALYAPYSESLTPRLLVHSGVFTGNGVSGSSSTSSALRSKAKRVAETLMRIAAANTSAPVAVSACAGLIDMFLRLPGAVERDVQLVVLAAMIKHLPQQQQQQANNDDVVRAILTRGRFWDFWDACFATTSAAAATWLNDADEDGHERSCLAAACELIAQCMRFGDGSVVLGGDAGRRLSHILTWIAGQLVLLSSSSSSSMAVARCSLAELLQNCIEQCSSILSVADCAQILRVLWQQQQQGAPVSSMALVMVEASKRALLYFPAALLGNNNNNNQGVVPLGELVDFLISQIHTTVEDHDADRAAVSHAVVRLLTDVVVRTRGVGGVGSAGPTEWSVHAAAVNEVFAPRVGVVMAQVLLAEAAAGGGGGRRSITNEDGDTLLYTLFAAFPLPVSLPPRLPITLSQLHVLQQLAMQRDQDGFRRELRAAM